MERYYFLFFICFLWTIFAVIHDLRKIEVSNWLNYSLLLGALSYRIFYSLIYKDYNFLLFGISGLAIFYAFALFFYYCGAFGGGDARLLRAYGLIIPFESYQGLIFGSISFIFLLFLSGAIYTILYTIVMIFQKRRKFLNEFRIVFLKNIRQSNLFLLLAAVSFIAFSFLASWEIGFAVFLLIIVAQTLHIYLKAVEKCCMHILTEPSKLTEGDWILNDIKLKRYIVKKTVHGLTMRDILQLKKARKKIIVKQGVPFVPAFLIAFLSMVFFFLAFGAGFEAILSYLF